MTSRRRRLRATCCAAIALTALAAVVVACSDDPERQPFPDAPANDAQASLPDSARPDAGEDFDAKLPYDPRDEAVVCAATPCVVQVVAGDQHFCARLDDGTVRCWGDDTRGALGAAAVPDAGTGDAGKADAGDAGKTDAGDAGIPIATVAGLGGITQLSASGTTTCALAGDGRVLCWGGNERGQLGLAVDAGVSDEDRHPVPRAVALPGKAVRVDVGKSATCAVVEGGSLYCWGADDQWQLARAGSGPDLEYGLVRGPGLAATGSIGVARTASSTSSTLGLTATGEVWSWGATGAREGLVAGRISSLPNTSTPQRVDTLASVTSIVASGWFLPEIVFPPGGGIGIPSVEPEPVAHACALSNGQVLCWGRSQRGALCTGLPDRELTPRDAPVVSKAWAQQLAAAEELTCARLTDGTVQCCGDDLHGRLGTGVEILYASYFTPARGFFGHAVQVAAGNTAVCAVVQGGTVECWGGNEHAELGLGTRDTLDHRVATKVAF